MKNSMSIEIEAKYLSDCIRQFKKYQKNGEEKLAIEYEKAAVDHLKVLVFLAQEESIV